MAYHPGFACNLSCKYCYQAAEGQEGLSSRIATGKDRAKPSDIARFVQSKMREAEANNCTVTLLGGEPLLYMPEIEKFLLELRLLTPVTHVLMITNGTLLKKNTLQWLTAIGCLQLQITLDGWRVQHDQFRHLRNGKGTYSDTLRMINFASNANISIVLRINVTSYNIAQIPHLLDDVQHLDCAGDISIYFSLINDTEAFKDENIESSVMAKRYGALHFDAASRGLNILNPSHRGNCTVCQTPEGGVVSNGGLVVSSTGKLYSCWESAGQAGRDVGNVVDGYDPARFKANWVQCGYHGGRSTIFQRHAENWAFLGMEDGKRVHLGSAAT